MGLKRVSWVRRYQGQCRALRPLGHQGYRLRNYKKDPPLCSGYTGKSHPPTPPRISFSITSAARVSKSGVKTRRHPREHTKI